MCIAEDAHELCLYLPVYSMRVLYIYALNVPCQGAHKVRVYSLAVFYTCIHLQNSIRVFTCSILYVYSLASSLCLLHVFYVCIAGGAHELRLYLCLQTHVHILRVQEVLTDFFWTLVVIGYSMCALQKVLMNCVCLLAYLVPTHCVCMDLYTLCVYCRRCLGAASVL